MLDPAEMPRCRTQGSQDDAAMSADLARSGLTTMRGEPRTHETTLLAEIEDLALTLSHARAAITSLNARDSTACHIPAPTDELDAIVIQTAAATRTILECCERLDVIGPIAVFGHATVRDAVADPCETRSASRSSGPQPPKAAMDQLTFDALLASFH